MIYSFEEQVVGKWVDGRALYQISIPYNNGTNIVATTTILFGDGSQNAVDVIDFALHYKISNGVWKGLRDNTNYGQPLCGVDLSTNKFGIYFISGNSSLIPNTMIGTFIYTKE